MFQIGETIVSLDIITENFLCDLTACKGECCIEGDSGAPIEDIEVDILNEILPAVWDDLSIKAQKVINEQGVVYKDRDGDMVTSIVDNKDCVFTYYDGAHTCKCAIEKAYKEGKIDFYKPISCHLYPVRLEKYKDFIAINYHRWKICKAAVALGKAEGLKIYRFLKEPLIRCFGEEWYEELCLVAEEYNKQKNNI